MFQRFADNALGNQGILLEEFAVDGVKPFETPQCLN